MTRPLPVETEIKLRVKDLEQAREALIKLGALVTRPREFEDNWLYDDEKQRLSRSGRTLRLRRVGNEARLTFKGPRLVSQAKSRVEVETLISDPEALESILEGIDLHPFFRYQKYRESYSWKEAAIVLDETPVGTFMEIEGGLSAIHETARALGYTPEDYITESYSGLFAAAGGSGNMVFK